MYEVDYKLFIPRIKLILLSILEFDYPVLKFFFRLAVFFLFILFVLFIGILILFQNYVHILDILSDLFKFIIHIMRVD